MKNLVFTGVDPMILDIQWVARLMEAQVMVEDAFGLVSNRVLTDLGQDSTIVG